MKDILKKNSILTGNFAHNLGRSKAMPKSRGIIRLSRQTIKNKRVILPSLRHNEYR